MCARANQRDFDDGASSFVTNGLQFDCFRSFMTNDSRAEHVCAAKHEDSFATECTVPETHET